MFLGNQSGFSQESASVSHFGCFSTEHGFWWLSIVMLGVNAALGIFGFFKGYDYKLRGGQSVAAECRLCGTLVEAP